MQGLRFACRMLWRAPAFSAMAILTLAPGVVVSGGPLPEEAQRVLRRDPVRALRAD